MTQIADAQTHDTTTHLLYLHGFRSSPQSAKARLCAERVGTHHPGVTWWCPQLPPSPAEAAELILNGTATWPREGMAVIGSSLGGFYARWLALQTGCRSVLLNPAVHPARDLAQYIGEHEAWHDPQQRFFFLPAYVDELRTLEADIERLAHPPGLDRQMAIVAQGDEVLDWREMQAFCAGGTLQLLAGSDHALSEFDQHIGSVFQFLKLEA